MRWPAPLVEVAIALSLLWLALRVMERAPRPSADVVDAPVRRSLALCAAFGLVHGLGFASAFAELGASRATLPIALLGFNAGVELGQLAILVPAALLLVALRRRDASRAWERRIAGAAAYVVGTASAYLLLVRAPDLLTTLARAVP